MDLPGPPPLPAEPGSASTLPVARKAAWWCWPLIAFALFPFSWLDQGPAPGVENPAPTHNPSDLAIFKMQGQVVIATFRLNPVAAKEALEDLSELAADDHSVAALALIECFLQPDSPRVEPLLQRFSKNVPDDLASATEAAVSDGVDETMRADLRVHLGWFADLARGPGLAAPPQDEAIRVRSFIVLGAMGLVFTAGMIGILVGGVLLFLHLRRLREGKTVNAFVTGRGPDGVLLECFALYLGIMTVGGLVGAYLYEPFGIISYIAAVIIPLLWPRVRGVSMADFNAAIGFHRGKGWGKEIAAGAVGYLGVLAIASIGVSLMLLLTLVGGWFQEGEPVSPQAHPVVGWMYYGDFWTKLACLGLAAGFAPIFEEIFFRGALHRYFRGRFRFFASALLTGVIFAALHPQGFFAIPALASIGIGFSLLREWRDSLVAPMVAHAINNGALVLMLWWIL
jgi:membrane protease YdiL (CAAX protease family)